MEPELYSIAHLAQKLNVKESWIRLQIFNRNIPFLKIGKHIRFKPAEIEIWIQNKSVSMFQPTENKE